MRTGDRGGSDGGWLGGPVFGALVVGAVVFRLMARPQLWSTVWRQLAETTGPTWWRRPPFLPLPSRRYVAFRVQTMYGGDGGLPGLAGRGGGARLARASEVAEDLVGWLVWASRERGASGS